MWGNCTISGETTDITVAQANPIRYRGYYYDDDTGLGDSWATKLLYQMRTLTVRIICYSLFTPQKGVNRFMDRQQHALPLTLHPFGRLQKEVRPKVKYAVI